MDSDHCLYSFITNYDLLLKNTGILNGIHAILVYWKMYRLQCESKIQIWTPLASVLLSKLLNCYSKRVLFL